MGIFSKTKTYVESTSVALHEEVKPAIQQTILNAVIKGRSVGEDLITNTRIGLGANANKYYRYGRDKYFFGLPEGSAQLRYATNDEVKEVIDAELDTEVTVQDVTFSQADPNIFAEEYLISKGWDRATNIMGTNPDDVEGDILFQSAEFINRVSEEDTDVQGLRIIYVDSVDNTIQYTEELPNLFDEPLNVTGRYYHVIYLLDSDEELYYWFYRENDATYPTLNVESKPELESSYFPIIPLRRDNEDILDESFHDTERYKSSRKLLKKISADIEDLREAINESPDLDDLDHAFFVVAAPLQSENYNTKRYLYEYFNHLYATSEFTKEDYEEWDKPENTDEDDDNGITAKKPSMNVVSIKEDDGFNNTVGQYNVELSYLYIEKEVIQGNLLNEDGSNAKVRAVETESTINPAREFSFFKFETSVFTIRYQINENSYEEIRVHGLKHVNYIYKNHSVDTSLADSLEEDSDDFNLILDINAVNRLPVYVRTDLMQDAMRLTFNSVKRVKLKWYQTGAFATLLKIAAIVYTIYTFGADGGTALATVAVITGTTNVVINVLVLLALTAVEMYLLGKAFELVVQIFGAEIAAIAAVVLAVYGLSGGNSLGFNASTALKLQSGITAGIQAHLKNEIEDVMSEATDFEAEAKAAEEELDKLMESLPNSYLDPFSLIDPGRSLALTYEDPDDYYNTRIHSGNIGTLAFQEIENFVDINLRLEGVS